MTTYLVSDPSDVVSITSTPKSSWLKHPVWTYLNTPTVCKTDSDRTRQNIQGSFLALGGKAPIIVSDTTRQLPTGSITFYARNRYERDWLLELFGLSDTILVQLKPPTTEPGDNLWIRVGQNVKQSRAGTLLVQTDWYITIDYTEQEAPS